MSRAESHEVGGEGREGSWEGLGGGQGDQGKGAAGGVDGAELAVVSLSGMRAQRDVTRCDSGLMDIAICETEVREMIYTTP